MFMFLINDIRYGFKQYTCFKMSVYFLTVQQLGYVYPHAYNCSVPEAFSTDLPVMLQICAGKPVFITSTRRLEKLLSSSGEEYLNFAKSHNYVDGKIIIYVHPSSSNYRWGGLHMFSLSNHCFLQTFMLAGQHKP